MDKGYAQRLLELELGHVVDNSLYAFDGLIDEEGSVVVVFQMDEEDGRQVFGDVKVDGVFPVYIEA